MLIWLSLLFWKLRGRRQVRLQLVDDKGAVDGVLVGIIAGHYVLRNSSFIAHVPNPTPEAMNGETWVPTERVLLLNVQVN